MPNFAIYVANSMACFFSKKEAGSRVGRLISILAAPVRNMINRKSSLQDYSNCGDVLWPTSFIGCGSILNLRPGKLANCDEDVGWFLADRKIGLDEGASDHAALIDHVSRRDWQHPLGRSMTVPEVVTLP